MTECDLSLLYEASVAHSQQAEMPVNKTRFMAKRSFLQKHIIIIYMKFHNQQNYYRNNYLINDALVMEQVSSSKSWCCRIYIISHVQVLVLSDIYHIPCSSPGVVGCISYPMFKSWCCRMYIISHVQVLVLSDIYHIPCSSPGVVGYISYPMFIESTIT